MTPVHRQREISPNLLATLQAKYADPELKAHFAAYSFDDCVPLPSIYLCGRQNEGDTSERTEITTEGT